MNPATTSSASPPKRRRWPLVVGGTLALLVVLVIVAPLIAAPIVRGLIEEQGSANIHGTVALADLSLSLGGSASARGLEVVDDRGERVATIGLIDVQAEVLPALSGRYRADVIVEDLELHVRRDADGTLNLARLAKPAAAGDAASPGSRAGAGGASTIPDVTASLKLQRGTVVVHGTAGRTELRDLTLQAYVVALDQPAPFDLSARVVGPSGEGGTLRVSGSATAAGNGRLDGSGLSAVVEYALDSLLLEALAPAVSAFAPIDALGGGLQASGSWAWNGGLALTGQTEWALSNVRIVAAALGEEAVAIPSMRLSARAELDAQGDGRQGVQLDAGSLLTLRYEGTVRGATGPAPALAGNVQASGQLGELLALAGEHLSLKAGVQPSGAFTAGAEFDLQFSETGLPGGRLSANMGLAELAARDAEGRPIDLGELTSVDVAVAATADPSAGRMELTSLQLTAGPVVARAKGRISGWIPDGDPARLEVSDGELFASADLDRLQTLLAPLLASGVPALGGRVEIESTLGMREGRLAALSNVRVERLLARGVPAGDGLADLGPLDLTLLQEADFDPAPGGEARLHRLQLRSAALDVDASGAVKDPLDAARRAGRITQSVRVRPALAAQQFGAFLAGFVPAGEALTIDQTLDIDGAQLSVAARVTAPRLAVHGGALGEEGARVADLDVELAAAAGMETLAVDVRSLRAAFSALSAMGSELPAVAATLQARWDPAAGLLEVPSLRLDSPLLAGGGSVRVGGLPDAPAASADLVFEGQTEPLRAFVAGFVPALAPARGAGGWRVALSAANEGQRTRVQPEFRTTGLSLTGLVVDGRELPLRDADLALTGDIDFDASGGGRALIEALRFVGPGVELDVKGSAAGLLALTPGALLPPELESELQVQLQAQPGLLAERLSAFLGGLGLQGEALAAGVDLATRDGRAQVKAQLSGPRLRIDLPPDEASGKGPATIEQRDLALNVDAEADLRAGSDLLTIRAAEFRSATAQASVVGEVRSFLQPAALSSDLTLRVDATLQRLLADLGAVLPLAGWQGSGALALEGAVRGTAGRVGVRARASIADLDLQLPASTPGGAPVAIADRDVALDIDADVTLPAVDLDLREATVRSSFLRGTLSGQARALARAGAGPDAAGAVATLAPLKGELYYVPDKLGALLAPFVPVKLSGAEERPLSFRFDGPLSSFDPVALLGGLQGEATVGLGRLELAGFTAGGALSTRLAEGRADVDGTLQLLGGAVTVQARLDARPAGAGPVSRLQVTAKDVGADGSLGPLLAMVHPLLAGAKDADVGSYGARLSTTLDFSWAGALPLDGALPTDFKALTGTGLVDLSQLKLSASPLLGQMLSQLDQGSTKEFALQPLEFAVKDGRVGYTKPWVWSISKVPTSFTGSVGLDGSLDLTWNVPVTDKLREKHKFLAKLGAESLAIPIRGSAAAPDLQWGATLENLAKQALEKELKDKVDEKLGGVLGGLGGLGGAKDDAPPPPGGANVTPEALLAQADALWAQGNKADAMPLYQRLKDDFKLTMVFILNKKKIEKRAKGED